ncbi:hypothetical protein BLS_004302 [Venturia inaequalis]|uniref:Uncharacterized protein n=1 Tax=Venturia inaequalis TaxID=5025 RepID=A0A8H3YSB9_VENIN|nr:hypothetical protein BLS_004302 [Venturia inaequalis]KAE9985064.1 hypothetical protein EG327_004835 [Venturia inaequalis]KAE9986888.1 hypothetical protein EG328_004330 [Venturia inaequalis]RDI81008.1 Deoxyribodipyrimidine photo-lyase [Venturia inaequalis]
MKFSLIALTALPLLAAASPIEKRQGKVDLRGEKPKFYHGVDGWKGNCSDQDYATCRNLVRSPVYAFINVPKKEHFQCWAVKNGGAGCFVWDGEF